MNRSHTYNVYIRKCVKVSFTALMISCFLVTNSVFAFVPLDIRHFHKAHCRAVPLRNSVHRTCYLQHHRHHHTAPGMDVELGFSRNWCGYVSLTSLSNPLKNSVTNVFGNWEVPVVYPSKRHTHCAIWVGIDGYKGQTVEQIGTAHGRYKGKIVHYAWFEIYPGLTYQIKGFPVHTKDRIGGQVQYVGNSRGKAVFQLTIFNYTQYCWWIVPEQFCLSWDAERNSAGWIVEAPSKPESEKILPLAHFSPIRFSNCQATIQNVIGPINDGSWKYDSMNMVSLSDLRKAKASHLRSDGSSFSVYWKHE